MTQSADRGVSGEQICLRGDILNKLGNVADLLRTLGERGNILVRRLCFADRDPHYVIGLVETVCDFHDGP